MSQNLQDQKSQILSTWIITAFAFLFSLLFIKLKQARQRKIQFNKQKHFVSKDKIVLAIEIKDFLVKYSDKPETTFLPLEINEELGLTTKLIRKILKLGHYYKPLFTIQKIKEFILGLKSIQKIQLCLYSSLSPTVVDTILSRLHIQSAFPQSRRRFCDLENDDDQKHAIQVDQDSRRVIIVTPTYEDHFYQDEKYFLVVKPKFGDLGYLKQVLRSLKAFVQANQDINSLHEELAQYKIQYEASDVSDYQI